MSKLAVNDYEAKETGLDKKKENISN